jgi:hypothetical protein
MGRMYLIGTTVVSKTTVFVDCGVYILPRLTTLVCRQCLDEEMQEREDQRTAT